MFTHIAAGVDWIYSWGCKILFLHINGVDCDESYRIEGAPTLQEKASQARQLGNSRRSSIKANASFTLGMVSIATRSAPADTRQLI